MTLSDVIGTVTVTLVAFGYDQIPDEMASGRPLNPAPRDREMLQGAPHPTIDPKMEVDPDTIPKAPLNQVPEENLLPGRPDFFQRKFDI
jgi:hypothetical protein